MMALLPGGVQIYYGDETYRPNTGIGGTPDEYEHGTRSMMNFPADINKQSQWVEGIDSMGKSFSSDAN
ncbi:hypothetical protein J0J30_23525, partial [Vibrio vulnificus]|nr:hypothetical protein [Vibrio vulnificus]